MMLSPENYSEFYLEGKTADEIRLQIRNLQAEIRKLRRLLKEQDPMFSICPSYDIQLEFCKEYLALAKIALAKAEQK